MPVKMWIGKFVMPLSSSNTKPITKKATTERMAGLPDPVALETRAKSYGPQIAENLE